MTSSTVYSPMTYGFSAASSGSFSGAIGSNPITPSVAKLGTTTSQVININSIACYSKYEYKQAKDQQKCNKSLPKQVMHGQVLNEHINGVIM